MIFKLLGLICLTVLLVNATPVLWIRHKLGLFQMKDDNSKFRNRIIELLSCPMCLGTWVGFIYFIRHYPFLDALLFASIVAIFSELLNKLLRV